MNGVNGVGKRVCGRGEEWEGGMLRGGIGLQSTGEAAADALGLNPGDVLPGV